MALPAKSNQSWHWLSEAANQWHVSRNSKQKIRSRRCLSGLGFRVGAVAGALLGVGLFLGLRVAVLGGALFVRRNFEG